MNEMQRPQRREKLHIKGNVNPNRQAQKPKKKDGHELHLQQIIDNGGKICVGGLEADLYGKLIGYDKFSITMEMNNGVSMTIFKHAITYFHSS